MARRALLVSITLLLAPVPPGHSSGPATQMFDITAKRYEFSPSRIEVTEGDAVRLTIRSADRKHGFGVEALGIKEDIPRGGRPVTIEFVADRAGEFPIECTEWCGSGHKRMKGMLVVRAKGPSK